MNIVHHAFFPVPSPPRTLLAVAYSYQKQLVESVSVTEAHPVHLTLAHKTKVLCLLHPLVKQTMSGGDKHPPLSVSLPVWPPHLQVKLTNHPRPYVLHHVPSTLMLTNCLFSSVPRDLKAIQINPVKRLEGIAHYPVF